MKLHQAEELTKEVYRTGKDIRKITLYKALSSSERELIKTHESEGDEGLALDLKPKEILIKSFERYCSEKDCSIEIIGEAFGSKKIGDGDPKYIVHVDLIDGTRETSHRTGISYFEAGIMPWKKDPRLSDTETGVVVAIGFDPITGRLYSYFSHSKGSYRLDDESGNTSLLQPTKVREFNDRGFFNTITSFRGTGILPVLKDRMFEEMYGKPDSSDVFHRETLTSCGELVNVAKGSSRGVMDLRPAVSVIAGELGIEGYDSPAGLCMHPYDVSGAWPIIRDTNQTVIAFYDGNLKEVNPEEIQIRNVEMDIGYIACGNQELFEKTITSLRKVLGNNYF